LIEEENMVREVIPLSVKALNMYEKSKKSMRRCIYRIIEENELNLTSRRLLYHYVVETIRRLNTIDFIVCKVSPKELIRDVSLKNFLRVATYLIKWDVDFRMKKQSIQDLLSLTNSRKLLDILNKIKVFRLKKHFKKMDRISMLSLKFFHPKWFLKRMLRVMKERELIELMRVNNKPKNIWIRVNRLKIDVDSALKILEEDGVTLLPDKDFPYVFKVCSSRIPLPLTKAVREGYVIIQDKASVACVEAMGLRKGDTVWDVCAAPAMKACLMSDIMENTGIIYATDYSIKRLFKAHENMMVYNAKNIELIAADVRKFKLCADVDKIMIDAPCTSTGVFRSEPDYKWRMNLKKLGILKNIQRNIIKNVVESVKNDTIIVYSTCSLLPDEGEEQIAWLLKRYGDRIELLRPEIPGHPGYSSYKDLGISDKVVRLFPHLDDTKGFFIAKFLLKGV